MVIAPPKQFKNKNIFCTQQGGSKDCNMHMFVFASALTVLKLWKRLMLCGGGGVSMGNCRKGFMSRWGWIIVGVRKNVGTAAPALLMPPTPKKRRTSISTVDNNLDHLNNKIITGTIFLVISKNKVLRQKKKWIQYFKLIACVSWNLPLNSKKRSGP